MSTKGLDSILKSIQANPDQKILRDRYLSLISELSDHTEKNRRVLELAQIVLASDPSQAMNLGHLVYRQDRKSEEALTLIHKCLVTLGRHGKASMVLKELEKVKSSKLPPIPDTEKTAPTPESINQGHDGTFKIEEPDGSSDSATVVFEPKVTAKTPGSSELPNLPDGRTAPPPMEATVVLTTESPHIPGASEDGPMNFSLQSSTPDIPIIFSPPTPPEAAQSENEDLGAFDIPSLTQMQRELIDIRQNEIQPPAPKPELNQKEDLSNEDEKADEIPDDFLAPITKTLKTYPPDAPESPDSQKDTGFNLPPLKPQAESASEPDPFEDLPGQPTEPDPFEAKTRIQISSDSPAEEPSEAYEQKLESREPSEFSGQMSGFANQFELIFKHGLIIPFTPEIRKSPILLSPSFKKALEHWFKQSAGSNEPGHVKTILAELAFAIWQSNPDKEGAAFLGRSGLHHSSPGLWALWLDCLTSSGLHRRALYEIRHLILTKNHPDPVWLSCSWTRYESILEKLGLSLTEGWKVSDGPEKLKAILARMPEVGARGWVA